MRQSSSDILQLNLQGIATLMQEQGLKERTKRTRTGLQEWAGLGKLTLEGTTEYQLLRFAYAGRLGALCLACHQEYHEKTKYRIWATNREYLEQQILIGIQDILEQKGGIIKATRVEAGNVYEEIKTRAWREDKPFSNYF